MKKVMLRIFSVFGICTFVQVSAFAANDCSNEDNDAIAAEFALCSTHVYNIGETQNQDGADRDLMRDVIAMKTTVMTQQLYKQYEQMESVLQRFKTQLEKAVLADTLKAAGAKSEKDEDSSSTFKSTSSYIKVSGAQNCSNKLELKDTVDCLYANYQHLDSVTANGTNVSREHKQQLASDYVLACKKNANGRNEEEECEKHNCAAYKNIKKQKDFETCMSDFMREIGKANDKVKKENSKFELFESLTGNK